MVSMATLVLLLLLLGGDVIRVAAQSPSKSPPFLF